MMYKGIKLHKNSKAYELAQDKSPEGVKRLEKHIKEVNDNYKKATQ